MQSAPFFRKGMAPSSTATQDFSTCHSDIPLRVGYQAISPLTSILMASGTLSTRIRSVSWKCACSRNPERSTGCPIQEPRSSATSRICLRRTGVLRLILLSTMFAGGHGPG